MTLIGAVVSCKKDSVVIPSDSYSYFPTTVGHWIVYEVDSVYHSENDNNNDDSVYTYHFEIKEVLDSSFIDGAGRNNQIIKHYRRNDSLSAWSLTDVWTQTLITTGAYRCENNISVHKLSFPLTMDALWNGNDANTLEPEMFSYEYLHQPDELNFLEFDSTLSVLQTDENNYIEKLYGKEIYATGVGLIFKERDELGKRNGIIVKGLEYRMKITSYGND
jgi:hypothetical protein